MLLAAGGRAGRAVAEGRVSAERLDVQVAGRDEQHVRQVRGARQRRLQALQPRGPPLRRRLLRRQPDRCLRVLSF